jgi:hypothetical protein
LAEFCVAVETASYEALKFVAVENATHKAIKADGKTISGTESVAACVVART